MVGVEDHRDGVLFDLAGSGNDLGPVGERRRPVDRGLGGDHPDQDPVGGAKVDDMTGRRRSVDGDDGDCGDAGLLGEHQRIDERTS